MAKNYEYLTNTPLGEACGTYLKFLRGAGAFCSSESVPVTESLGRITSEAVYSRICSPHYNACAMDGIAVAAALTYGATDTTPVFLGEQDFVRVDTGDPLPGGKDAVVMIEDCVPEGSGFRLYASVAPWQNVRQIGEDIAAGDMIVPSYSEISPACIGAFLAGGVLSVPVLKKPVVAIIPTGDEIVLPSDHPLPGDVMEFNSSIFSGMLRQWGAEPVVRPIVRDDPELLRAALSEALEEADAVLMGAGTSAGRDDYTASVIASLGTVVCHGIAIKPGKPALLGAVGSKPVIGLPGYPVSGIVVMEELVRPVIDQMLMRPRHMEEHVCVKMGKKLTSSLKYREFVRVSLGLGGDGMLTAVPLNRGAGVVTSFIKADAMLDVPQACEGYEAGDRASATLLRPIEQIERTVRIVGSHDPLIDEAADILRRQNSARFISSAHVGSMGGILAVSGGEAQMGGVHLLDPKTGIYNLSYIEKYIPDGGVALVECVQRIQGLMVRKGNPKGILSLQDLVRSDVSYVNRQKGSGTRVLLDYLLSRDSIPAGKISGYLREEMTHTAVAAQIAGDTADCGLGILSAANLYGLDFIPLWEEQYDLLVSLEAMQNPAVKEFLAVLSSEEFRSRLTRMGGYRLDQPGKVRKLWI